MNQYLDVSVFSTYECSACIHICAALCRAPMETERSFRSRDWSVSCCELLYRCWSQTSAVEEQPVLFTPRPSMQHWRICIQIRPEVNGKEYLQCWLWAATPPLLFIYSSVFPKYSRTYAMPKEEVNHGAGQKKRLYPELAVQVQAQDTDVDSWC